ncbi:DUF707 domain-containing protein [Sporosarcina globispora]|uniref:DUF707 domain-containing protein n=1 Tax=Sporosarcina globispora TaxID=1459 RepID=UPI0006A9F978|nr:DUF707 domain-containing protein [Sporosarcina globispora]
MNNEGSFEEYVTNNDVKKENMIKPFHNTGNKRFLVMARVGDTSLHKEWLQPNGCKNFDLFLEYYGNGSNDFRNDCDFYSEGKDTKWPRLYRIIEEYGEHIFNYDAVWIPDDDISTDYSTINQMLEIFMHYDLLLAQPALTKDSFYSHKITKRKRGCLLRYTQFAEVMAPIFSREALQLCWKSFVKSRSGWGLDSVWPKILGYPQNKIAIIDKTPVQHTRPIRGGTLYKDIEKGSEWKEIKRICKEYGVTKRFDYKIYGQIPK